MADLEGVARDLLAACGLEYEPACLEFHRTQRRVKTASIGQVRQPIYSRSVARWRNYESELDFLFRALPNTFNRRKTRKTRKNPILAEDQTRIGRENRRS